MRVLVIVIAALAALGLAAFGVVAAQRASEPAPSADMAAVQHSAPVPAPAKNPVNASQSSSVVATLQAPIAAPSVVPPAAVAAAPIKLAQNGGGSSVPGAALANANPNGASNPASGAPVCDKPGGLGVSRTVEIDTTGGPGFGFEHFKQYDFLRDHEVVLTFDDGPWPVNTPAVVKALTDYCAKATFFQIGEHAVWHPEITKMVAAAGMTVGTHTWSHKDLAKNPYASDLEQAKQEIELGVSAVHAALDGPVAPFFRFPDLQHPPQLLSYLAERNIATFSTDLDSFDFKLHRPEQVVQSVMGKLQKRGKGIILMHDFQRATGEAMPELLRQLKLGGYKIVHMVARAPVTTVPKYDEMLAAQNKLSVNNTRPESSVVRTIGGD